MGTLDSFLTVVGEEKAVNLGYGVTGYFFFSIEDESSAATAVFTLDIDESSLYAVDT